MVLKVKEVNLGRDKNRIELYNTQNKFKKIVIKEIRPQKSKSQVATMNIKAEKNLLRKKATEKI